MMSTQATSPSLTDRFRRLIEALCAAVYAGNAEGELAEPVICLIWEWLRRKAARFAALAARVAAGAVFPARPRPAAPRPLLVMRTPQVLPRTWCWLAKLVPDPDRYRWALFRILEEPEMQALVAAAPQIGRIMRPLAIALGGGLSFELMLPPTPRAVEAAKRREERRRRVPKSFLRQMRRRELADHPPLEQHHVSDWLERPKKRA